MPLTNSDEIKTGEQIVLQKRFWNVDVDAFFFPINPLYFFVLQMKVMVKKKMEEIRMKIRQKEKTNPRQRCSAKCYLVILKSFLFYSCPALLKSACCEATLQHTVLQNQGTNDRLCANNFRRQ